MRFFASKSRLFKHKLTFALLLLCALPTLASAKPPESCFSNIQYGQRIDTMAARALYIIVDQTTPLSPTMRQKITDLVSDWGVAGDLVKVVRFSANMRDQYPEMVFFGRVEQQPGEEYMYNLRWSDKDKLRECLAMQKENFSKDFHRTLSGALNGINPEIPKTDLFYSLKQIATQLLVDDEAREKNILLISDGLENSGVASFYARGKIRPIDERKVISVVRRQGLVANWKNANIYMYGLGLSPKTGEYVNAKNMEKLSRFWERYFVEGNGSVKAIGNPELLLTSIN